MKKEIWKNIPGLPDYCLASNLGRIKKIAHQKKSIIGLRRFKERILNGSINKNGYIRVHIRPCNFLIHRLVLSAFKDQPAGKNEVNHKNGIKSDNTLKNLEWVSRDENVAHALKNGLIDNKGENNPAHKLTEAQVIDIRIKATMYNDKELGAIYKVRSTTINSIRNGKKWKHLPSIPEKILKPNYKKTPINK